MQELWQQNQALRAELATLHAELETVRNEKQPVLRWEWLSQPWVILALSLGTALVFVALVIFDLELSKSGGRHSFFLFYIAPIGAAFVAFLLDRVVRAQAEGVLRVRGALPWLTDLVVIAFSLARTLYEVPFISGHALFLTYALLTVRSRVARALAGLVLAQVVYLKLFAWQDPTLYGGVFAALAAVGLFFVGQQKSH